MYYRRKLILSLLEVFGNRLEKVQLQKLLMILSESQAERKYHFVPYKYGCFSFQANADLSTLQKYQLVMEDEKSWRKTGSENYLNSLKKEDIAAIVALKESFGEMSTDELIKYTYEQFPYYAINSKIAEKYLDAHQLERVKKQIPETAFQGLFTIGYEGLSLEEYINKLIKAGVAVLVDVRKNSFSMKYGFSKSQLQKACAGVGIQFFHFPEVGIVSDKRQELRCQADYDALFEDYKKEVLPQTQTTQEQIIKLIEQYSRVAITCFEADICQCHRKHLAEAICNHPFFQYELVHL